MTSDELTAFAQRYAKAWCTQNPESVAAFFAEDGWLTVNDGAPAVGRAAIAEIAQGFMREFPDMVVTMDDVSHDADGTKFHWTLTGTNTGPGGTGNRVRISGYELWKIDDGLIAESKGHFDSQEYERQLKHGIGGKDSKGMEDHAGFLARIALAMTDWTERWVPDAFIFALIATVLVVIAGIACTPSTTTQVIDAWGKGFWELIPFTLQMSLIIITGHVLATSPPIGRVIRALAAWPTNARNAVALVTLFAMASSWVNWGFSLIFSAVLAKEIARRVAGVDYRALAAASFLGIGSVWAQGLSGSAALQMATPGALQPQIRDIVAAGGIVPGGIIPFRHTIFLWQSVVSVVVEIALVTLVMWLVTPPARRAKTARDLGIELGQSEIATPSAPARPTPGQWLEHSPILNWLVVLIGGTYLVRYFMQTDEPLNAINLNIVNLTFLLLGFLLHKTPARMMHAVQSATPAVWGVILQFPFYAGIAAIITSTHLSQQIAHAFVGISNAKTFPAIVAIYSAVLGVFVPSGGSKWVVEAPYVMAAAHELKVHLGWVVAAYDLGEALANLVQPFWMLPILGLFRLRARDVMGYTFVVFLVLVPVVLLLVTILGATLSYPM